MRSMKKVSWSLFFGLTLIFSAFAVYGNDDVEDDTVPDVTARVSRISLIRGDVQIRRVGSQDWEKAVLNLPIVEGDEIMTDAGGRLEIQLNLYSHIRLAESSYLKVVGLKDGAVALSLSEGSINVRLSRFDKDSAFFEIDAPKTTIAIQKSGMYRIDAGKTGASSDVRVTVTNEGEARVYADNSGFTLKTGRAATLKIDGPLAGEWETLDASRFVDEFDSWSLERDAIIAKRIKDAFYDKYYDQDIYGAEDLNDNGEWIYTKKHGHVWRPYRSATSSYANWSPYRYGHWRWVPPYGWTWVNDEPWAWATYHHGRWFFDDGYWYWTPYGYTRRGRSWWFPALVGVTIINTNIYWYPLPRDFGYFNYNHCFGGWGGPRGGHHGGGRPRGGRDGHYGGNNGNNHGNGNNGNNNNNGPGPTPTPAKYVGPLTGQVGPSVFTDRNSKATWLATPPLLRVPPGAVVGTTLSSFGRDRAGFGGVRDADARAALSKAIGDIEQVRVLPTYVELNGRVSTAIKVERPRDTAAVTKATGAAIRQADGGPMDNTLRTTKILGGREPIRSVGGQQGEPGETHKTGAVKRPPVHTESDEPVREAPTRTSKQVRGDDEPVRTAPPREVRTTKQREERESEPVRQAPRQVETRKQEQRSEPVGQAPPRNEPVRQAPPRNDPPPTRSEPVREAPRSEPVRNAPPPRSDPPPSKSETRSTPSESRKKDN